MLLRQLIRRSKTLCRPQVLRTRKQLFSSIESNQSSLKTKPHYLTSFCEGNDAETSTQFVQYENLFAYQIVSKAGISAASPTIYTTEITDNSSFTTYLDKNWRESSAAEISQAFSIVKQFCIKNNIAVSDHRFNKLVDGLMDHCENLTDRQLYNLLRDLSEYPASFGLHAHNYHDIWSCLDDMCCWKMHNWDVDTMLAFSNLFFLLRLGKVADYVFALLDRLLKKADILTKDQMVQIFFLLNVCRRMSVPFEYEHALQYKVREMNVDELAVVAMGYFKTTSKIKLIPITKAMIDGVTTNAMGIHEISLGAIMKTLRFTCPVRFTNEVNRMLDALLPELDRFSELAILHVALLATGVQQFHPAVLRKCSQNLVANFSKLRLKEIERSLNVLTMFTFDPKTVPDIFEVAFQELHNVNRIPEMVRYPKCLPAALHYFSIRKTYSHELMNRVLDMDFITSTYGKSVKTLPIQMFSLDSCIDIECPDYNGKRLPPLVRYKAAKWLTVWPPSFQQYKKLSKKDLFFLDVIEVLKTILPNENCIKVEHVLPHFSVADIIVSKDLNTQTFMNPTTKLSQYQLGDVMKVKSNSENEKWYSIMILTWNNVVRVTSAPLGHTAMKIRQLEACGYVPIPVISYQFEQLSLEEKQQYFLNKLT